MRFVGEPGKAEWPSWMSHGPEFFTLQLLFINFKFPDLGVNHFCAITEINLNNTENSFLEVPFSQPFLSLSGLVLILPLFFPSRNNHQLVGQNYHHHIFPSKKKKSPVLIPSLAGNASRTCFKHRNGSLPILVALKSYYNFQPLKKPFLSSENKQASNCELSVIVVSANLRTYSVTSKNRHFF